MHQNRAILCGCGGDFYRSLKIARFFDAPRCAISSAKKITSEPRFLLRRKWVKMVPAAEFIAIPSSAVKIASERRCAILVHSGRHRRFSSLVGHKNLLRTLLRSVRLHDPLGVHPISAALGTFSAHRLRRTRAESPGEDEAAGQPSAMERDCG